MLDTMVDDNPINLRSNARKYVYGLGGLAELLGCTRPTAQKIKDSGKIPFAKVGKKFIFNEDKVMAALAFNPERGTSE